MCWSSSWGQMFLEAKTSNRWPICSRNESGTTIVTSWQVDIYLQANFLMCLKILFKYTTTFPSTPHSPFPCIKLAEKQSLEGSHIEFINEGPKLSFFAQDLRWDETAILVYSSRPCMISCKTKCSLFYCRNIFL